MRVYCDGCVAIHPHPSSSLSEILARQDVIMVPKSSKTLLLVEDEIFIALAEQMLLQNEGYCVLLARSGEEAVEIVQQGNAPIDLILMDINLGSGKDGTQAASEILARHDIPVIFLSSHTEKEIVAKAEEITSYGYLVKDSNPTVLFASIKMAFKLHEAHQKIQERENSYRRLVESSPDILYQFSSKRGGVFYSAQVEEVLGYTREYLYAHPFLWNESIHPDDIPNISRSIQQFDAGEPFDIEYRIRDAHGAWRWLRDRSIGHYTIGDEIMIEGLASDLTSQKLVETDLLDNRRKYQLLAENVSDVIWILDLNVGSFSYISPSVERLRGFSVEEALTQDISVSLTPESLEDLQTKLPLRIQAFQSGQSNHYKDELRQPCKDGSIIWVETTTSFRLNETNGHLEVYGVSRDITDRKRSQAFFDLRLELLEYAAGHSLGDLMQTSLDKITAVTDSPIGFFHFVEPDQQTLALQAWSTRTTKEYCHAEGKGLHYNLNAAGIWADCVRLRRPIMHNDYARETGRKGLPEGHAELIRELVVPVFRGDKVVSILGVGNKAIPYITEDLEIVSHLADVVWEIVQRKKVEERVQSLLHEKETLLKEVHHRIKNNMNSIASLLQLQMMAQHEVTVKNALQDAESRVRSMMILYDQLYRTESFTAISVRDYFPPLLEQIISIFDHSHSITVHTDLEDVVLTPRIIYPLGIILNELTTNAMKYAFAGQNSGAIRVTARKAANRAILTFEDDGIGIPLEKKNANSGGFGLRLVQLLVKQIDGFIVIEQNPGSRFIIEFPYR